MTHYILFPMAFLIGLAYSVKYGKKAVSEIKAFDRKKQES